LSFLVESNGANRWRIGPIRLVLVRCIKKVDQVFMMVMAACNLVRMRTLGCVSVEGA
jgi:hypothetical protein